MKSDKELIKHYNIMLRDAKRQREILFKVKEYLESVNYEAYLWMPKDLDNAICNDLDELQRLENCCKKWISDKEFLLKEKIKCSESKQKGKVEE